jgi:hypothetical protein
MTRVIRPPITKIESVGELNRGRFDGPDGSAVGTRGARGMTHITCSDNS